MVNALNIHFLSGVCFYGLGLTYAITLNAHFKTSQKNPAGYTTNVHAHFRHFDQSRAGVLPLYGIEPALLCCSIQ